MNEGAHRQAPVLRPAPQTPSAHPSIAVRQHCPAPPASAGPASPTVPTCNAVMAQN
jgi:hypothetical protein